MKITTYPNRTVVNFNIESKGNKHVFQINSIYEISKKYNAQDMLFQNKPCWIYDNEDNAFPRLGNTGGSIIFHGYSCDHSQDHKELVKLLLSFGLNKPKYFREIIKTHRDNGMPYKLPQHIIEEVKMEK